MAGIIAAAVARLKDDVQRFLSVSWIALLACELGLVWKQTPLAVPQVVALLARQILGGNLSMPELARRAGSAFTPEAYCTARGRLPLKLLQVMLRRICEVGGQQVAVTAQWLWKGHRLWHMDGSSFSMPDTPDLQRRFGQPCGQRKGCGFPVAHILCLFDAASGLIQECILSPLRTHDLAHAGALHPQMRRGDILIADRAFESFAHLALLLGQGLHLLVPVHQRRKVDFRRKQRRGGKKFHRLERQRVRRCGRCDQIVRWLKPLPKPRYMSLEQYAALPETIEVREIKRNVCLPSGRWQTIVLVTTLLDEGRYPAEELLDLLKDRWQVEVNLRHLKTTMHMEILRSQTAAGVEKELWMFLIVYNLVRLIILEAAARQRVDVGRISFADALYWVRHGDLTGEMPPLLVVPERPGRVEPRAVKRRNTTYRLLRKPREVMRQALGGKKR
jgi:hypothetical protein